MHNLFFSAGIVDEVLNRLHSDSSVGAIILQSEAERKPATHFVNKDVKVLSDSTVNKGTLLHLQSSAQLHVYSIWTAFSLAVLQVH